MTDKSIARQGVLVTLHSQEGDYILSKHAEFFASIQASIPRKPSVIAGGTGERFNEAMLSLGFSGEKLKRHDFFGERHMRVVLTDEEEASIHEWFKRTKANNFIIIADPCVVRAFDKQVHVEQMSIYHLMVYTDGTFGLTLLNRSGQVLGHYPTKGST